MKKLGLLFVFFIMASCGPVSINRSYLFEMEDKGPEYMVADKHFESVPGDEGKPAYTAQEMYKRTPDKEKVFPQMNEEEKLKTERVNKLSDMTEEQRAWFAQNEHFFTSESQKIYFLGLSTEEQQEYLMQNSHVSKTTQNNFRQPSSLVRYSPRMTREIALGMDKASVVALWGNPHRVDVAGNPRLENERWTFFESGTKKYIYFAAGQVEGWVLE